MTPRGHRLIAIAWALALVPTLLWWKDSILWVAFMSLYANVASHWSAAEGAEAKEEAKSNGVPPEEEAR